MPEPHPSRGSFLDELRRRKVVRVGIVYAAVAWAVTQVADVALSSFQAPPWVMQVVIVLLALGFPVAVALAWAFDVTPEGVRRTAGPVEATAGAPESEGGGPVTGSVPTGPSSDAEPARWLSPRSVVAAGVLVAVGASAGWLAGTSADAAADDRFARSIAVLPFANLAGEDEQYFVEGIHDDILTQLSQLEDLIVISRTTMVRYAGTEKTLPEIAAELGVATVLEGSVQKRGDRVRITAQLIDASSDAHLWADNFDETLDDYFEIQSRIAIEIAGALQATLSPAEEERVARAATDDPAALDRYLRGIVDLGRWWGAGDPELSSEHLLRRAVDNLEAATELDPEYAVAWARLSEAFTELVFLGAGGDITRRSARQALRRAQELDPELPEAAYSEALYAYHAENRYEDALALLARAQRLAPSDARIHRARGWVVRRLGRYEEAVDAFERSLALDPLGAEGWKVLDSYMHARRYDRLLEIARRLEAEDPQGSAVIATWWEVTVAAVRDGDLTGADRMLAHWPAIFHASYVDDPHVNAPWSTWLLGLDDAEIASLVSGVEDLLPTVEGSPFSLSYALAFRAWALHDVLGHPDARDAALAYERAADGMIEAANTPQFAVGVLGQRAMNYLRLGEPERAVALADSLARAFPPGLDEWWSSVHARRVRAAVYARVGREGEAIDILKPLVPPPSHYTFALLRIDPTWEPLRGHPRWAEILEAAR